MRIGVLACENDVIFASQPFDLLHHFVLSLVKIYIDLEKIFEFKQCFIAILILRTWPFMLRNMSINYLHQRMERILIFFSNKFHLSYFFLNIVIVFSLLFLISPCKMIYPFIWTNENPLCQRCFVPNWIPIIKACFVPNMIEIDLKVLEKKMRMFTNRQTDWQPTTDDQKANFSSSELYK